MQLNQFGNRTANLNRILITGGGLSGKTTLASKFVSSPDKILFLSTDGNANSQGYYSIDFEFPEMASNMRSQWDKMITLVAKHKAQFEAIALDLVEDYDEHLQSLLYDELNDMKKQEGAWGAINKFYKYMNMTLKRHCLDKRLIFLSRDEEEYYTQSIPSKGIKRGDIKSYVPALRKKMRNILLKDHAAELRCYVDGKQRRVDIEFIRYEEKRGEIERIIAAKPIIPSSANSNPQTNPPPQYEIDEAKAVLEVAAGNGVDTLMKAAEGVKPEIKKAIGKEWFDGLKAIAANVDKEGRDDNT